MMRQVAIQAVVMLITITMLWDEPDAILTERLVGWLLYFLQVNIAVYGNMYVLVPRLLLRGRTMAYYFSLLGLVLGSILTVGAFQPPSDNPAVGNAGEIPSIAGAVSGLIAFYMFIMGLTAVQLLRHRQENIRRIEGLKNATMKVELANLQNQINPHFLFNMLNNANIMAGEDVDKSSFILTKLNDLLHYQIEKGSRKTIRLEDDIAFLDDYLALEKLRRDRFDYSIGASGCDGVEVPPLLFIPFVENAVKHNPGNDSYVALTFRVANGRLHFECENPKARSPRTGPGGIGLVNIRRRLDLLFGENYSLVLRDEGGIYRVEMEIRL